MTRWLTSVFTRNLPERDTRPSPEEVDLMDARRESSQARELAREAIERSREDLNWLEVALIPISEHNSSQDAKNGGQG